MAGFPIMYSFGRNGVPFLDASLNQAKQITVRESNRTNFHPASFTQGRATGIIRTLSQPTPQTFTTEVAQSMGMNGINSTEARKDSGMLNTEQVARAVGMHTNIAVTTTTDSRRRKRRMKCSEQRRFLNEGILCEEARSLEMCTMPWSSVEKMLMNNPQKKSNPEDLPGPPIKILKMPISIDKQDLRPAKDEGPLRVGITNSKPMSEDEMKMLHRHLIIVITKLCPKGGGPEFMGFSHKSSWVLVTCVNQRSKDWLVHEVPYLKPWPGALLSIIPDQELPKPPTASVFIPVSEAFSLEEAIHLLKAQNKGLNTELWKVRSEKVELEMEGRLISFDIDDPSADALRAQNCQAAIGFKMVTFKIRGQYRPYTPLSATQNQVTATPTQSAMPDSSSKPDQARATVTSKEAPQRSGADGTVFGSDKSVLAATKGRSQRGDSPSHIGASFCHDRAGVSTINPDKYSFQAPGGMYRARNNSPTACPFNKSKETARDLPEVGFGAPPNFQSSLSGNTLFTQRKNWEGLTADDTPSIGRTTIFQNGMEAAVALDRDDLSGPSKTRNGLGRRPITRVSQFGRTTFGQVTHGEADRTVSDYASTLKTNPVRRGQVEAQIIKDPQSHGAEAFDQSRTEIDLPVSDPDEPLPRGLSPEAEGGYHTWIIEDLESYGDRLSQEPVVTGALTSAIEPSPLARDYSDQSHSNQFDQYSRTATANQDMTLDRGQARDGYATWSIGTESHESHQGRRTVTREPSLHRGLLPDSHIRPFQGHSGTDRVSELDREVSHEARGRFGERTHTKNHGKYQDGRISDRESRSRRGLLPNPRGNETRTVKPESNGRPFHGSRGRADRIRSHRLSQASYEDRIQDPGHKWTSDRESRSHRRLSPQARSSAWTIEESHRSKTKDWDGSTGSPRSREVLGKRASVGVSHSSGGSRLKPRLVARESWRVQERERVKRSDIRPR